MTEDTSPDQIQASYERCQKAFLFGKSKSPDWRLDQLECLERMLTENEGRFYSALESDLGKSATEAWLYELSYVVVTARHARKNLHRWMRDRRVTTPAFAMPGRSWIHSEPLGSVLIIAPWNYPLQLCLAPLVAAISAGNCAVLKPSEVSPATSAVLAELIPSYMDSDCIHVVEGGAEVSTRLLELAWDHIVFTGGGSIAKIVMAAAARHLTPLTLELGGKSPCIVLPDADLDVAAKRIAWGRFTNAGQTCVAPDYLMTDRDTALKLIPRLRMEIAGMFGDDPSLSDDYGRIVNDRHFQRLCGLIEKDKTVAGGRSNAQDRYIEPTILYPVEADNPSMQEEIFGPVLPIMEITSLDQAIAHIQSNAKPLAAYLFSNSASSRDKMVERVSAGNICLNDVMMFVAVEELPFRGVGASGFGSYKGEHGFRQLSHEKAVMKRTFWPDIPIRYAPASKSKMKWLKFFR